MIVLITRIEPPNRAILLTVSPLGTGPCVAFDMYVCVHVRTFSCTRTMSLVARMARIGNGILTSNFRTMSDDPFPFMSESRNESGAA